MHPPARSVAVLHFGHGFVVSRIATADDGSDIDSPSAHRDAKEDEVKVDISKGADESEVDGAGSQSPMWKPCENPIRSLSVSINMRI